MTAAHKFPNSTVSFDLTSTAGQPEGPLLDQLKGLGAEPLHPDDSDEAVRKDAA